MSRALCAPRGPRGGDFARAVLVVAVLGYTPSASAVGTDTIEPAVNVPFLDRGPAVLTSLQKGQPEMLIYPAKRAASAAKSKPKPAIVMLHGMCDVAENECPHFAGSATQDRALLCPRANLRCDGGGTLWSGKGKLRAELLASFLDRAARAMPTEVDPLQKPTLVGFSLGSFVALDVAQRSPGKYKDLILLGAKVEPDPRLLKEAGIESVLFGAGDRDMMHQHMVTVAAKLARHGIRSRFVGMGDVGHWFAPDMNVWLTDALAWLALPDQKV